MSSKKAARIAAVKDPWVVLNIKKGSDPKALKTAFQKAAMRHHPDAGGCTTEFMEVQKAYKTVQQLEHIARRSTSGDVSDSSSARAGKIASLKYKSPRKARNSKAWSYFDSWKYNEDGKVSPTGENIRKNAMFRNYYTAADDVKVENVHAHRYIIIGSVIVIYVVMNLLKDVEVPRRSKSLV